MISPPRVGPLRACVALLLAGGIVACSEEPPPPVERIRSVETLTVAVPASGAARRYSGVVEAGDSSSLSFEVAGVVEADGAPVVEAKGPLGPVGPVADHRRLVGAVVDGRRLHQRQVHSGGHGGRSPSVVPATGRPRGPA